MKYTAAMIFWKMYSKIGIVKLNDYNKISKYRLRYASDTVYRIQRGNANRKNMFEIYLCILDILESRKVNNSDITQFLNNKFNYIYFDNYSLNKLNLPEQTIVNHNYDNRSIHIDRSNYDNRSLHIDKSEHRTLKQIPGERENKRLEYNNMRKIN